MVKCDNEISSPLTTRPRGAAGVMNWSLGLEPWSGVLEWILGVEPWSAMLEQKINIDFGGNFVSLQ